MFETFVLIGAMFILKYGSILNPIRDRLTKIKFFEELFKCALCLGWWVGLFFGLFFPGNFILWGFYSSAVCWVVDHVIMIIHKHLYEDEN
jgi:hypothetical protein